MKSLVFTIITLVTGVLVQASDLRIISWNVDDATPHSKAQFIAGVAREQKADILALQNINASPYYHANEFSEALGANWSYRVTTSAKNSKQLAIFWNTDTVRLKMTKVPNIGIYEETDVQGGDPTNMPAQIGYFQKGAFDFFLINVNLMNAWEGNDVKLKQAEVLHAWISGKKKALSGTENDFIVAGTFNFAFPGELVDGDVLSHPAYAQLEGNGLLTFTLKKAWQSDPKLFSYMGDWFDDPRLLDGFALSKPAMRHHSGSQVLRVDQKFKDMDDYRDDVSDHLPVIARFKTNFED